jgi:hypothetical protein
VQRLDLAQLLEQRPFQKHRGSNLLDHAGLWRDRRRLRSSHPTVSRLRLCRRGYASSSTSAAAVAPARDPGRTSRCSAHTSSTPRGRLAPRSPSTDRAPSSSAPATRWRPLAYAVTTPLAGLWPDGYRQHDLPDVNYIAPSTTTTLPHRSPCLTAPCS